MSNPNKNTAILLDSVISSLDLLPNGLDIIRAIEEFALGTPLDARALDVCWGLTPIITPQNTGDVGIVGVPTDYGNLGGEIILSRGMVRLNNILQTQISETAIYPSNLLEGYLDTVLSQNMALTSATIQDSYAFGSIFLTSGLTLTANLAGLAANRTGQPILMVKDIDSDEVKKWLHNNDTPQTAFATSSILELVRFVLDINYFSRISGSPNITVRDLKAIVVDLRRPRGWGGYCEEVLASNLVSPLIAQYQNTKVSVEESKSALLNLVTAWVSLAGWDPTFIDYWQTDGNDMPDNLKNYLLEKLGIDL